MNLSTRHTSANAMTSWNTAYNMTQSLSAQPVRMGIYSVPCGGTYARVMNQKQYELKDHLGNVRVTFSDRKEPQDCDNLGDGWVATATSVNNYYSFGMLQPGRNWNAENYRFGFNGKENDNEVKGTGNSVDFGARIYDSRLGRWMSCDPIGQIYISNSTYSYAGNNPIKLRDENGGIWVDSDGNVIVTSTGNTQNINNTLNKTVENGIIKTTTLKRTYETVQIYADNGTPITALKLVDAYVEEVAFNPMTGEKTTTRIETTDYKELGTDIDAVADCHGFTFGNNKLWINNDQVGNLMNNEDITWNSIDPNCYSDKDPCHFDPQTAGPQGEILIFGDITYSIAGYDNSINIGSDRTGKTMYFHVLHSAKRNQFGSFDNNAGFVSTEYYGSAYSASRGMGTVIFSGNRNSENTTKDVSGGTVSDGLRVFKSDEQIK